MSETTSLSFSQFLSINRGACTQYTLNLTIPLLIFVALGKIMKSDVTLTQMKFPFFFIFFIYTYHIHLFKNIDLTINETEFLNSYYSSRDNRSKDFPSQTALLRFFNRIEDHLTFRHLSHFF